MRRTTVVALLVPLVVALFAAPALGHASLDVKQAPADTEVALTLRVPIEIDSANVEVRTLIPAAFEVPDCAGPEGWSCEVDEASNEPDLVVVWSNPDGSADERFALTVRTPGADAQGTYLFPTVQTYADGTEARWIQQESDGDRPAPKLQVGDENAEIVNNAAAAPHEAPSEAPTADPEPTSAATSEPTPTAAPSDAPASDEGDGDGLFVLVVVGLLVVAGAGLAVGFRQARSTTDD